MEAASRPHYAPGVPAEIVPPTTTVDTLLPETAKHYPANIALEFLGRTITYGELAHQTRKAAGALYRAGVRKGDIVAVILPNCPQHVVAFYAILSLGAAVAEHNPLAPAAELHDQIDNHGAKVVIAWEQTIEKLAADGDFRGRTYLSVDLSQELPLRSRMLLKLPVQTARDQAAKLRGQVPHGVLSFDRIVKKAPSLARGTVAERPGLDDLAVLLHTGGTTGSPKAAELTHRNLMSNMLQTDAWVPAFVRGKETYLGALPLFHAFGLNTIMLVGVYEAARLVLLPKFDVPTFLAAQRRHPITTMPGVAPMFARILNGAEETGTDISSITFSFSGAMALDPELAARWEAATSGPIIEGYGMTEASPIIAGSPTSDERRPSTLGIPFPSTEIRIVDPEDLTRDADGIGEIIVRGPQVFRGYRGLPEETANVLTEDGWLRTGDLGYWDNGFIVMADRSKELIINGGFNIYPSQVEDAIRDMPGVVDVAVVGIPDAGGESVVAALVLEPETFVDLDAVRRWTQDRISHYAMPRSIAVLESLPKSQLGKVQRKVLKEGLAGAELLDGRWVRKAKSLGEATLAWVGEKAAAVQEGIAEYTKTDAPKPDGVVAASETNNAEDNDTEALPTKALPDASAPSGSPGVADAENNNKR